MDTNVTNVVERFRESISNHRQHILEVTDNRSTLRTLDVNSTNPLLIVGIIADNSQLDDINDLLSPLDNSDHENQVNKVECLPLHDR
jgi:hypothetical protein